MIRYFGFAVADSMFPKSCVVKREEVQVGDLPQLLQDAEMCLNPSHAATILAAKEKFGLELNIPEKPPMVKLAVGDEVIVMSVRGLPRLTDRHEYTQEEIESATFEFGLWKVIN